MLVNSTTGTFESSFTVKLTSSERLLQLSIALITITKEPSFVVGTVNSQRLVFLS